MSLEIDDASVHPEWTSFDKETDVFIFCGLFCHGFRLGGQGQSFDDGRRQQAAIFFSGLHSQVPHARSKRKEEKPKEKEDEQQNATPAKKPNQRK